MNIAIVGCGHIAKKHAEAIEHIVDAKLIAVCDFIPENMTYYIDTYGAQPYTQLDALLADPTIDIVSICTPSGTHAAIAVQVAQAGKHVIIEKPIALTIEDTDAIITACEQHDVKLAVVHPNRFRPVMMELRSLIDGGKLGKISHANATVRWNRNQAYYDQAPWRGTKSMDGGVLMNQAIHNLDLLLWFMGDVEEVYSMTATRLRDIETEDVAAGVVRFHNGALGIIEAATTIYPENLEETLSIFGERGTIKIGGKNATRFEHIAIASMTDDEIAQIIARSTPSQGAKTGHHWIIEDMIAAIREDREPIVNGHEGKKALQLVLKLYESADTNRAIRYD